MLSAASPSCPGVSVAVSVNARSTPVAPLTTSREPAASVRIEALTPALAALIAFAIPSRLELVASMVMSTGVAVPGVKPVIAPFETVPVPSVRVSLPCPIAAALSATGAACAVWLAASWRTSIRALSVVRLAPLRRETLRIDVFELVGWVASVPPRARPATALAKLVMLLLWVAALLICAVSVSSRFLSRALRYSNCFSTSSLTSAAVSMPDAPPSVFGIDSIATCTSPFDWINGRHRAAFRLVWTPFSSNSAVSGTATAGMRPPARLSMPKTKASTVATAMYRSSRIS